MSEGTAMDTYIVTLRGCLTRNGTSAIEIIWHKPFVLRALRPFAKRLSITEQPWVQTASSRFTYHAEFTLDGIEVEANSAEDAIKRAAHELRLVLKRAICRYRLTIY